MLTLPINKKWYDMILSGEKTEEYREIKPYYTSRFEKLFGVDAFAFCREEKIRFRNGYSKQSPSFIASVKLSVGKGRAEWGAIPDETYYILHVQSIKEDG